MENLSLQVSVFFSVLLCPAFNADIVRFNVDIVRFNIDVRLAKSACNVETKLEEANPTARP